jgi:hypothetical protein
VLWEGQVYCEEDTISLGFTARQWQQAEAGPPFIGKNPLVCARGVAGRKASDVRPLRDGAKQSRCPPSLFPSLTNHFKAD